MDHLKYLQELSMQAAEELNVDLDEHVDTSKHLVCIASIKGYFLKLNATWEKCLGYSRDELLAQPWLAFVHPEDVQATIDAANEQAKQDIVGFVNRYRHKDGHWVTLRWLAMKWNKLGRTYAIAEILNG